MFPHFRKFPSFIFPDFSIFLPFWLAGRCCWEFHHEFILSGIYIPSLISFMFRHFRTFPSLVHHFRNFRHSHVIIFSSFPDCSVVDFYVPSLPAISVIHISSLFHHFRIIPSLSSVISGNFRHSYHIIISSAGVPACAGEHGPLRKDETPHDRWLKVQESAVMRVSFWGSDSLIRMSLEIPRWRVITIL